MGRVVVEIGHVFNHALAQARAANARERKGVLHAGAGLVRFDLIEFDPRPAGA